MTTNVEYVGREAHRRSLAKAVSWRVTGSIDTFILSWLITGNVVVAGTISAVEILTKIGLFYAHERIWARIRWGRHSADISTLKSTTPGRAGGL